jgi:hypothetical protein
MSNHTDRQLQETETEGVPLLQATPPQLLGSVTIGSSPDRCYCTACHTHVGEGQEIGLYAYWLTDTRRWDVARVFCRACTPDQLAKPTLGVAELLVTGTLGTLSDPATQSHRLCVAEVLTQQVSPPTDGVQP